MPSNVSLYGSTANNSNVGSNNFTTLYSPGAGVVRTQLPYGNSNVVSLLNIGTDGGNTITNIVASGNMTIGNITATGNVTADYFFGNFIGNISGNLVVPGSNTSVLFNQQGNAGASDAFQFNYATNVATITGNLSATNISGNGAGLSGITGANVTGQVSFAATANSVAVGNVSGIGNIAVLNLDGNSGNILYGNGIFAAVPNVSNVANANYANFAGQVVDATQSNITTVGTLTTLGVTGNATFANTIILSSTNATVAKIAGVDNAVNANARQIFITGGNISNDILANGNSAGRFAMAGGEAFANTDPGSRWDAIGGNFVMQGGAGSTANGSASGGSFSAVAGGGFSNLYPALGGDSSFSGGRAVGVNGNSTGGTVTWTSGRANSTISGTSTSGNINLAIGNVNGASGNIRGSINIGSLAANADTTFPENINIGQANTPTIIGGNANVTGNLNVTANANITGNLSSGNANLGNLVVANFFSGDGSLLSNINGSNVNNVANANYANFAGTAFSVAGANVSGEVANANYASFANIASTANLATFATTANAVAGANVSGIVANANYSAFANVAASANSVAVANVVGIGNIAVLNLDGSSSNVLFGNGVFAPESTSIANANYANFAGTAFSVSGSNVSGEVANANYASYANIAATANSVAVANVVGIGNIATINLTGSSSNVLYGNGVFAPESQTGNANYANFAGTVVNATQSNITLLGTLTSLSVTGNATIADTIILSSTTGNAKIVGVDNSTNASARGLNISAGSVTSPNVGNSNSGGALNFFAGSGIASTDPGSRFDGRGGSTQVAGGGGSTANGSATGGSVALNAGNASSNLYTATGGNALINSGRATGANGNATSGSITIATGRANATTTGSATSGNINLLIGNANGVSGNTIGSINIGSLAPNANVVFPLAINIGQANTQTVIGGNANVSGNLNVTANANVAGNLNVTANANVTGNVNATGSGLFNSPANGVDTLKLVTNNKTNMNLIRLERYGDTANLGGIGTFNMYRTGGTQAAPAAVANNDVVYNLTTSVYGDSGNIFVDTGGFVVRVGTNYGNGTVTSIAEYNQGSGGTGQVTFNYDTIIFNGASTFNGNVNVTGNANIGNLKLNRFQETVYSIGSTSGTITPDFNNGSIQSMTLTGGITMNSLGNAIAGRSMTLILTQDGTGGRTLTSTWKFADGFNTLSVAPGDIDIISVFYDGSTYYATLTTGYV